MKQTQAIYEQWKTGANGLSPEEAAERLRKNGKNALREAKKKSWLMKLLEQFKDTMILVLLAAAAVSAVLAIAQRQPHDLIDSGIILFIVILNAVIGLIQENKAEAAMEALKNMNKPFAKVLRGGQIVSVPTENIVVGDVIQLEAGDTIPADLRLIESASLKIEESALTGESVPVEKDAAAEVAANAPLGDRVNMAYCSGAVTYGRGTGVVVACGMDTEVGKIAEMLTGDDAQTSPLQNQLAKTAKLLSILVLAIAAVIFAVTVIRDAAATGGVQLESVVSAFMTAVAIAVAAIPEGLPATVTIVLAMGVQKMSKRNAIVRNLPSVETLGSCEIICSDKTGTLTLNRMTVRELYTLGRGAAAENCPDDAVFSLLLRTLTLCNDTAEGAYAEGTNAEGTNAEDAYAHGAEGGKHKLYGDPTETALVQYFIDRGGEFEKLNCAWPRVDELPFDSERKRMTTVNRGGSETVLHVKGAPDLLLECCTKVLTADGARKLTDDDRAQILAANQQMGSKALRVLAAAVKAGPVKNRDEFETELTFVGLVGMIDPSRPEVKDAVAVCKQAGMRPLMITGDHKDTAAAIAREIGILEDGQKVMTGAEIDACPDDKFAEIIPEYSVFARVSPENKVKIVRAYQSRHKIVAMTGDGVNDAPSIKAADIGIGMGITGTDVSKGAADMILADDNFATIVGAVEEGRKIYANIKKAVQFLLSANIAEVLCLFIVSIFLGTSFLTPVMILWINLVTDSLPALGLGTEAAESDVMRQKPRQNSGSLFAGETGLNIMLQGAIQTALVMLSYCIGNYALASHPVAMTMSFVTLAMIQLFHAYNLRSLTHSVLNRHFFANKLIDLSFVIGTLLVVGVLLIPGARSLFGAVELNAVEWLVSIGCSLLIIPVVEVEKWIVRRFHQKNEAV